jgi:cytochrome P450
VTAVDASVFEGSFWRDPYPAYERLRAQAPVREVALPRGGTTWLITRYDDVRAAFTDPRLVKDHRATLPPEVRAQAPRLPGPFGSMMILLDPPDHTRLRRLVSRAFTARRTAELRPRIETLAAGLLDAVPVDEPVDLLATYAVPLPMAVICELLGCPTPTATPSAPGRARWSTTTTTSTSCRPPRGWRSTCTPSSRPSGAPRTTP